MCVCVWWIWKWKCTWVALFDHSRISFPISQEGIDCTTCTIIRVYFLKQSSFPVVDTKQKSIQYYLRAIRNHILYNIATNATYCNIMVYLIYKWYKPLLYYIILVTRPCNCISNAYFIIILFSSILLYIFSIIIYFICVHKLLFI